MSELTFKKYSDIEAIEELSEGDCLLLVDSNGNLVKVSADSLGSGSGSATIIEYVEPQPSAGGVSAI